MNPGNRVAGIAGMTAGLLLMLEAGSFLASGWSPERFADPAQAMGLLREGGPMLRTAAVLGFAGLVATVFLVAGLAAALYEEAPARASGLLYLGIIGIAGHALVPLGLWIGIPAFLGLAAQNSAIAEGGWAAFAAVSDSAHGVGSLFTGIAMLLAGSAMTARTAMPRFLGWTGIGAGLLTLASLLTTGTPAAPIGGLLFLPALLLTVIFRLWAGVTLWRRRA